MIETINTYEGREFGTRSGSVKQIFKKLYRCTTCGKTFDSKEKGAYHANSEHMENSYRLRDADTK